MLSHLKMSLTWLRGGGGSEGLAGGRAGLGYLHRELAVSPGPRGLGGEQAAGLREVVVLDLEAGGEGGRVPVQGVDAGAGGRAGQVAGGAVRGLARVAQAAVPDVQVVKTQSVIVSVVQIWGLGLDEQLVFNGKILVKLRLDPAVVKVEDVIHVEVHGLGLNLRLSVLEVSLHLVTSLKQTEDVNTGHV